MKDDKATYHQAMVYVYDLGNCAKEFGFKNDEVWELNAVSDRRKKEIERQYYPTVSAKALPEALSELLRVIKKHSAGLINLIDGTNLPDSDLQYLVAYNLKRLR